MLISCQNCSSQYEIDENKITEPNSFIRCKACKEPIFLHRTQNSLQISDTPQTLILCPTCETTYSLSADVFTDEGPTQTKCYKCKSLFNSYASGNTEILDKGEQDSSTDNKDNINLETAGNEEQEETNAIDDQFDSILTESLDIDSDDRSNLFLSTDEETNKNNQENQDTTKNLFSTQEENLNQDIENNLFSTDSEEVDLNEEDSLFSPQEGDSNQNIETDLFSTDSEILSLDNTDTSLSDDTIKITPDSTEEDLFAANITTPNQDKNNISSKGIIEDDLFDNETVAETLDKDSPFTQKDERSSIKQEENPAITKQAGKRSNHATLKIVAAACIICLLVGTTYFWYFAHQRAQVASTSKNIVSQIQNKIWKRPISISNPLKGKYIFNNKEQKYIFIMEGKLRNETNNPIHFAHITLSARIYNKSNELLSSNISYAGKNLTIKQITNNKLQKLQNFLNQDPGKEIDIPAHGQINFQALFPRPSTRIYAMEAHVVAFKKI